MLWNLHILKILLKEFEFRHCKKVMHSATMSELRNKRWDFAYLQKIFRR